MLLDGKRILVTGVLTPQSIAFAVARVAQEQGAEVVLTGFGKGMGLTQKTAKRLPTSADVIEMDVNDTEQLASAVAELGQRWDRLDGILHAIAFAPQDALGGNFLTTPWDSAAIALRTSAFSLKELTVAFLPMMEGNDASVVSVDFDAARAWPIYDWMGVSKASLESVSRYLARDLGERGVRVNCIAAGPLKTIAAKGIPGFERIADAWVRQAPLGWDVHDPTPVGNTAAFLFSDLSKAISGEIIHVDGGFNAMGGPIR